MIICTTGQAISLYVFSAPLRLDFLSLPRIYQMVACRIFMKNAFMRKNSFEVSSQAQQPLE